MINKPLLLHLVSYLYYWQMGFNSVFKGLNNFHFLVDITVTADMKSPTFNRIPNHWRAALFRLYQSAVSTCNTLHFDSHYKNFHFLNYFCNSWLLNYISTSIALLSSRVNCCIFIVFTLFWPASWSSGQGLWLLIISSRVRFPVLPWEFFLAGKDPRGDHGLGS